MSKTVLFQTIQFNISTQFSSIWPIDRTLSGATTPGQSGLGSVGKEGVHCISQSFSITGTSPSDCLVWYSTAPADRAISWVSIYIHSDFFHDQVWVSFRRYGYNCQINVFKRSKIGETSKAAWNYDYIVVLSPMAWETRFQSQVESYQRLKNGTWCLLG